MTTQLILTVLIIGISAGVLSGLVGIGGGIVMVPALVYFVHYTQHQAQGTSLAVLTLPVVILASIYYYKECRELGTPIDLKIVAILAFGFVGGAYFGSKLALVMSGDLMKKIFAVILFYTAFKMTGWEELLIKWVKRLF